MQPYTVLFQPGPAWTEGASIYEQDLQPHAAYLQLAFERRVLLFAGPFSDSAGGLAVFMAASPEEAQDFVAADPAVISGLFTAQLHPQHLVFNRYVDKGLTNPGPGV